MQVSNETEAEAKLVDVIRREVKPAISFIALNNHDIVGHIMFTPVTLTRNPGLMVTGLAPKAVLPKLQTKGIGSKLVITGLNKCRSMGTSAVVVLAHVGYYPKFSFVPSVKFGIYSAKPYPI